MAFWSRTKTASNDADKELLKTLLELEKVRLEKNAELEASRHSLELRKVELELQNMEQIGVERRKQLLFQDKLKEQRQQHAQAMRDKKAELARQRANQATSAPNGTFPLGSCEECQAIIQKREPHHSNDLLKHAQQHHSATLSQLGYLAN